MTDLSYQASVALWDSIQTHECAATAFHNERIKLAADVAHATRQKIMATEPIGGTAYTLVIEVPGRPTKFFFTKDYEQLVGEAAYWECFSQEIPTIAIKTTLLVFGQVAPSEQADLEQAVKEYLTI